jgi:hypothetical protein
VVFFVRETGLVSSILCTIVFAIRSVTFLKLSFFVLLAVAVDGQDVTNMVVGEVTKLMASRSNGERRLTVITSAPPSGRDIMDEAKVEEHT